MLQPFGAITGDASIAIAEQLSKPAAQSAPLYDAHTFENGR